jgi:nitroreductase
MLGMKLPHHHGGAADVRSRGPEQTVKSLMERASCRSFQNRKIPARVINTILMAGTHAATGGNLQPYSIIKVTSASSKKELADLCGQDFIARAPVDLLFCIDWHRIRQWARMECAPFSATSSFRHFWISFQDTVVCAQTVCTAAEALGLGSVYIGTVLECFRNLRTMFRIPRLVFPVVLVCLGYPKGTLHPRKKLGPQVVVHNNKYRRLDAGELRDAFNEKYSNLKVDITSDRLKTIHAVCAKVKGERFARRCLERIRKTGHINAAQRYFGLHYRADRMPDNNDEFLLIMEECGFKWFRRHVWK